MTLWQTSLTYRVWVWLCNVYEDSALHRILAAVGRCAASRLRIAACCGPCAGRARWPGRGGRACCAGF